MFKTKRNMKKFRKACESNKKGSYEKAVKYYTLIANKGNIVQVNHNAKLMEAKRLVHELEGK